MLCYVDKRKCLNRYIPLAWSSASQVVLNISPIWSLGQNIFEKAQIIVICYLKKVIHIDRIELISSTNSATH